MHAVKDQIKTKQIDNDNRLLPLTQNIVLKAIVALYLCPIICSSIITKKRVDVAERQNICTHFSSPYVVVSYIYAPYNKATKLAYQRIHRVDIQQRPNYQKKVEEVEENEAYTRTIVLLLYLTKYNSSN